MVRHYDLSDKDDWITPPELIDDIQRAVTIDIDPCAHEQTSHGTVNLRLEDGDDGLEADWVDETDVDNPVAYVNPPFSYKTEWLQKVVEERQNGLQTAIVVTPDGTDVISWYHGYIAKHSTVQCFCKGRVSYVEDGEKAGSPTFGTMITVFGDCPPELLDVLNEWGQVVKTIESSDAIA